MYAKCYLEGIAILITFMTDYYLEFRDVVKLNFLVKPLFSCSNCSLHWTAAASGSSTMSSLSALSESQIPACQIQFQRRSFLNRNRRIMFLCRLSENKISENDIFENINLKDFLINALLLIVFTKY